MNVGNFNDLSEGTDSITKKHFMLGNSKLCFELLEINSVTLERLPTRGGKAPPQSALLLGDQSSPLLWDRIFTNAKITDMQKKENAPRKRGKGGRPPKVDPATECVMVRFNANEYARFLTIFEQSGVYAKATFVKARIFNESFRVIKTDRAALEYVAKLTTFYAQFRAIGVNYNQLVKELHIHFSQKKALAFLYKLEAATKELAIIGQQIIALTKEVDARWSPK